MYPGSHRADVQMQIHGKRMCYISARRASMLHLAAGAGPSRRPHPYVHAADRGVDVVVWMCRRVDVISDGCVHIYIVHIYNVYMNTSI